MNRSQTSLGGSSEWSWGSERDTLRDTLFRDVIHSLQGGDVIPLAWAPCGHVVPLHQLERSYQSEAISGRRAYNTTHATAQSRVHFYWSCSYFWGFVWFCCMFLLGGHLILFILLLTCTCWRVVFSVCKYFFGVSS